MKTQTRLSRKLDNLDACHLAVLAEKTVKTNYAYRYIVVHKCTTVDATDVALSRFSYGREAPDMLLPPSLSLSLLHVFGGKGGGGG